MKRVLFISLIALFAAAVASAQSNKIVFGPLEGDDAGILTVHNAEAIEVGLWVRTNPANPSGICGVSHGLLSADSIIASRNGMNIEPEYDQPYWDATWVDGPFTHNPDDAFPIPQGFTSEVQCALSIWCEQYIDTNGEWDLYGTWLMVTNTDLPTGQTYYPYSMGWYPHSGHGTTWAFANPPGGGVVPEQDYCGLYFEPETSIDENEGLPEEFLLFHNRPNPFNASTLIQYSLPSASDVSVDIYDILGRKVQTLIQGEQPAGYHQIAWDASDRSSGIYFYRIQAGEYAETRKMVLLK